MYKSKVLTESECLWDQVSHQRFLELLSRENAQIINLVESENSFGEFLFVTLHFPALHETLEFYGLGFHWHKERWISDSWSVFDTHLPGQWTGVQRAGALRLIESRRKRIAGYAQPERSKRAALFEVLAEAGDEDGILSMIENYGDDEL